LLHFTKKAKFPVPKNAIWLIWASDLTSYRRIRDGFPPFTD
jgi:hypothetical protein